jgi:hypothetical protein
MKAKRIVSAIALSFFLAGCGDAKETTHQQTWPSVPPTRSCLGIVYLLVSIYPATTMPILVYLQLICMLAAIARLMYSVFSSSEFSQE